MKKIPLRRCVVTGEQIAKKDLLRIVRTPEGDFKVDPTGKANGHGAYMKKDRATLELALKKKALDKAFATTLPSEIYREIERYIND